MIQPARWPRVWPPLLAVTVVSAVGAPAATASYRHARDVVRAVGDPVMAPWLPLSVDGMLLAALVVIWVRRHRGEPAGAGPWAAFGFGMLVTVAANLAAVTEPSPKAYAVALFPPLALAITLELVALVAGRTEPQTGLQAPGRPEQTNSEPGASPQTAKTKTAKTGTANTKTGTVDTETVETGEPEPDQHRSAALAPHGEPARGRRQTGGPADRSVPAPTSNPLNPLLERVRELADRTGARPSRNAVMRELGIGAKRAATLLEEFDRTGPDRIVDTGDRRSA
jgi:hypothetical protein